MLSAMKQNERKALLRRIDDDVMRIQQRLDECYAQILVVEDQFKTERGDILREIRRQTKRSAQTNLILKVRLRERRVLRVPSAEWRTIEAKGNRVARAQKTLGQAQSAGEGARGRMAVFTSPLPRNRKFGWRIGDLRTYAHPAEIELVAETEGKLLPIRKRIAELADTGKRLLMRRYQHQRMLEAEPEKAPRAPARRRKAPAWASTENQLPLALEPTTSGELFERPQLRNPDGIG